MAIKTLKSYLAASGPLLVLFLLVTATTVLQHTDAVCDDEFDACFDDAVCNSCYYDWAPGQNFDPYNECIADYPDIDYAVEIDWCFFTAASDCCKDAVNSNDCLGNSAFLEHAICMLNDSVTERVGEGCTAMTCNDGSVAGLVDDDAGIADDDVGVVEDDGAGVVGDATGEANDDAGVGDDDAGVAGDTGGASRVGSSSPSVALTAARGLALMMAAAPCLAASL